MLKQPEKGCIVNTSSQGGITGFPGQAAYIACKHAIIGLTRTASIDYAAQGIRINAVLPGVILTPMAKDILQWKKLWLEIFPKNLQNAYKTGARMAKSILQGE